MDAEVVCILREDHPDFDEDDDKFAAQLHWLDGIYDPSTGITNWNKSPFGDGHHLQREQQGYLFHDLSDHVLGNDWDRVLEIGGIRIDVQLI